MTPTLLKHFGGLLDNERVKISRTNNLRQVHENLFARQPHSGNKVIIQILAVPSGERDITLGKSMVLKNEIKFHKFHDCLTATVFEVKDYSHSSITMGFRLDRDITFDIVREFIIEPGHQIVLKPSFVGNFFIERDKVFALLKGFETKMERIQIECRKRTG